MASPSRSSLDQETLRVRAKNLFAIDSKEFVGFIQQLFTGQVLKGPDSEARQLFDFAQKEYLDSLVVAISMYFQRSRINATRLRCARLLQHLLCPGQNLFCRLSPFAQNELKIILLRLIDKETFPSTYDILFRVVSHLAQLLVPKKHWPEAYDYLFQSLKSDVPRKNEIAALLFARLFPRSPELFLIHVDELIEAFRGLMERNWENYTVSVAAVGATVDLVLHLATPSNHEKYYDLLKSMVRVLSKVISDDSLTQTILNNMITLAGAEPRFLRPHIDFFVESMLDVAENFCDVNYRERELALEVIATVAEDKEYGCGMIQNISPVLLKRLFTVLLYMLAFVEDESSSDQADIDDLDEKEWPNCRFAVETFKRLVVALRENVILRSLPDCLTAFLDDADWQKRCAAITALGIIADGCSKASLRISETLVTFMVTLWNDPHPRVRWKTIEAAGQFPKNWGPHFQGEFYGIFIPALLHLMEDFDNPVFQTVAASTMSLFIKNCCSDVLRPHLVRILSNLCLFQKKQNYALTEAALASLAPLVDTFKEEFMEDYDAVPGWVNVKLAIPSDESNWMVVAQTIDCMTMIGLVVGKKRFMNNAQKIIKNLIFLQDCCSAIDNSARCYLLKAWGRLCKCLGTEFVPYLGKSLPRLLQSAQLSINRNSNTDDCYDESFLDEKAIACDMLYCFAEELTAEIHLWINEILDTFVPLLTFKSDVRVRTTAISAMPLMLHSASLAMQKEFRLFRSVEIFSDIIIPALLDALPKESEINIRVKILEALDKCIQIPGSGLDKSKVNQFINRIAEVLLVCSYIKTERRRRVEKGLDRREKGLLKEEIELDNNVYKALAGCLSSIFKIFKASILPIFDKLLPYLALMNVKNSTEERTISIRIFRDVAEHCGEDAFKHYEKRLLSMLKACDLQNPDVWEIVAHGISICAEFGGNVFRPHLEVVLSALEGILKNPNALHPDHVVAHEIAVVALGKICQYHCDGPNAYQAVDIWLGYLPLRNNLAEAKLVHDDLCTMIEKSENKVLGPHPQYNDFLRIIKIFTEVMWAGNNLATDDTLNRMKKLLKRYQGRILPSVFESMCLSLPFPIQTMLKSALASSQ